VSAPAIDGNMFSNTPESDSFYWTSSTLYSNNRESWFVSFFGGTVASEAKANTEMYIRPVRGDQINTLTVNSEGVSDVLITSTPNKYEGSTDYIKPKNSPDSSTILTAPIKKQSMIFSEWKGCDMTSHSFRTCLVKTNASKTVVANYSSTAYIVYFDAQGGEMPSPHEKTVRHEYPYGQLPTTIRTGYDFNGWYTQSDAGVHINASDNVEIENDHTLYAQWTAILYSVTPLAGSNGSITPAGPQTVNHGDIVIFTVTPNEGYTATVGGTCGGTLDDTTYTTDPITGDCSVEASFTPFEPIPTLSQWGTIILALIMLALGGFSVARMRFDTNQAA